MGAGEQSEGVLGKHGALWGQRAAVSRPSPSAYGNLQTVGFPNGSFRISWVYFSLKCIFTTSSLSTEGLPPKSARRFMFVAFGWCDVCLKGSRGTAVRPRGPAGYRNFKFSPRIHLRGETSEQPLIHYVIPATQNKIPSSSTHLLYSNYSEGLSWKR